MTQYTDLAETLQRISDAYRRNADSMEELSKQLSDMDEEISPWLLQSVTDRILTTVNNSNYTSSIATAIIQAHSIQQKQLKTYLEGK